MGPGIQTTSNTVVRLTPSISEITDITRSKIQDHERCALYIFKICRCDIEKLPSHLQIAFRLIINSALL